MFKSHSTAENFQLFIEIFLHVMNNKELDAIISLLEDPDESVYKNISEKLLSLGHEVIPDLEHAWETSFDPLIQQRLESIIHRIQFDITAKEIKQWTDSPKQNLLQGALIVTKYQYPDLDSAKIKKQIEQIKQDVWLELNDNLTALEKIRVLNHIIFDVHGFSGNTVNYFAPQNSFINNVLEAKKGNPISLCLLYAIIAQDLDLPIFGVNLPQHFVLAYKDEHDILLEARPEDKEGVLFYLSAFNKGAVFSKNGIETFLKQLKLDYKEEYFKPCSNKETIYRLVEGLMISYQRLGFSEKVEEMQMIMKYLE